LLQETFKCVQTIATIPLGYNEKTIHNPTELKVGLSRAMGRGKRYECKLFCLFFII